MQASRRILMFVFGGTIVLGLSGWVAWAQRSLRVIANVMARYDHLPIYPAAFDLAVHLEQIVRHFDRQARTVTWAGNNLTSKLTTCSNR